jgi:GntR family transcriptional regulator/MocR family aminotransferase
MPRQPTTPPRLTRLVLSPRPTGMSVGRWLCAALRTEILEGRLRPGTKLPATRELAKEYGLARGTVVSAFEQLRAEGYLEGNVGSGTFVNQVLPDDLLVVRRKTVARPKVERPRARRLSAFGQLVRPFPMSPPRPVRAFRTDQPALDLFPTTLWAQLAARRIRRASAQLLVGSHPMGHGPLREALADYLRSSRGVVCTPDQVAIVSGVQEALSTVARLVLDPGDRVCLEDPGYIGAGFVFDAVGAKVIGVPVDAEGMEVPHPRLRDVRLAFVTPGHQSPLGISMSLPRRLDLLAWARTAGALLFEDDHDSEYRYAGRPLPALQGLDRHNQVIFAGSFSKVLFPSIRLGYLVVPPDLIDAVSAAQSITTRYAPMLGQAVLCDFIVDGHFGRHVRRMREVYAERRSVLLENARERLAGLFEIVGAEAGLQTAGWLRAGIDAVAAMKAAAGRDVQATPLSLYARAPMTRQGLLLGFAAIDPAEIRRGVSELAIALERTARSSRR